MEFHLESPILGLCHGVPSDESPFLDDSSWDTNPTDVDYNSVFFEKFYSSLKG